ncbi:HNH endonuclease [Bradyrhizobium sp. ma5]|uniref:HNH endonuclease n=1 Tax=Bradyrhizobium sp. ma5 TaxID=3344828 RepID=UPI0035D4DC31
MALYFIKPVVWNSQGYQRPSGERFVSGYPADHGFGHEEWNNSPRLTFSDRGVAKHAFHTEGFGNQELDKVAGDIFVFMTASHGGKQYLVAVAGRSTALFGNKHSKERARLSGLIIDRQQFPEEVWSLEKVRKKYSGNYRKFLSHWKKEHQWFVSWTCPADHYLALADPVELEAMSITGRRRLVSMYGAYQEIERVQALRILDRIPLGKDHLIADNIRKSCGYSTTDATADVEGLINEGKLKPTTRKALIDARLGQGEFRRRLEERWGRACAVTRCTTPELLRASHIKPWRSSSNKERLDPANGLLLTVHLDALFDAGLITFNDAGIMVSSSKLTDDGDPKLHVNGKIDLSQSEEAKKYLRYHRESVFRS